MKKWRKIVVVTGILALAVLINTKSFAKTVIITTDGLNVREKASKTSDVLEMISKDEEVPLLEELDEWYKVKYNGVTGYISKDYSKIKEENTSQESNNKDNASNNKPNQDNQTDKKPDNQTSEPETPTTSAPISTSKQMKITENTKGYILPLLNSNIIHEYTKDQSVGVLSTVNGWAYIESNSANAWVRIDKLVNTSGENNETSIPVNGNLETQGNSQNGETTQTGNNGNDQSGETTQTGNNGNDQNEGTTQTGNSGDTQSGDKTQTGNNSENKIDVTPVDRKIMYVQEPSVYVRSGPATTYSVVDSLIINNSVIVTGKANDWYQVQVDGKTGFVASWLLGNTRKETTSRGESQRNPQSAEIVNTNSSTSVGKQIVDYAKGYLGCKYVYGGSGPNTFDCSGFTMYVYKHFGISLSHSATAQSKRGTYVSKEDLQPGDLVFFKDYQTMDGIGHCGIYIGGGEFIHASSGTGYCVKISTLLSGSYEKRYETARRII